MFIPRLGLKCSSDPEQLQSRLIHHPAVLEFYTAETDFTEQGLALLRTSILGAKEAGVHEIVLHHPMKYQERFLELVSHPSNHPEIVDFIDFSTQKLMEIAEELDCLVLIHGSYEMREPDLLDPFDNLEAAEAYLFSRMDYLQAMSNGRIVFENGIAPLFSFGKLDFDRKLAEKNYPLAYDVSHAFIHNHGNQEALEQSLTLLKDKIRHYHLVDSMGETHDSLALGQGKIDWKAVLPLLNESASAIYEIVLKDQTNPAEQLNSHDYLSSLLN